MFKALNLFKTELTNVLETSVTTLPIPSNMANILCDVINQGDCIPCSEDNLQQGTEDYTKLVIFHNGYYEIVKVVDCDGGIPIIERGDECTTPRKFPKGACVQFIWTSGAMQCAIQTVVNGGSLSNCEENGCLLTTTSDIADHETRITNLENV